MAQDPPTPLLQTIITAIDAHMNELKSFGFHNSVQILAMAKLDLQTKLHGISDAELQMLCDPLKTKNLGEGKVINFKPESLQDIKRYAPANVTLYFSS